jgi:hypothetical protein
MTTHHLHSAAVGLVLLAAAASAQTFVVDAGNGPGTNFTDLPTAVAAVPDGATLEVRPGSYGGFTLVGRGITILGGPGVDIVDAVDIRSTSPMQAVTLHGLRWPSPHVPTITSEVVSLRDLTGPTLLEELDLAANPGCHPGFPLSCLRPHGLRAANCTQLHVRRSLIACAAVVANGNTVFEDCVVLGEDHMPLGSGYAHARTGLTVLGGTTQVAGPSAFGGGRGRFYNLLQVLNDGHAIYAAFGDLRLLGGSYLAGNGSGNVMVDLFVANNPLRIAPSVTVTATVTPSVVPMPALRANSAAPGGSLTATASSLPGDLVVLALGFPAAPVAVGLADPVWLQTASAAIVGLGIADAGGTLGAQFAVPNQPGLRGTRLVWQAIAGGPFTGLQASNPAGVVVR